MSEKYYVNSKGELMRKVGKHNFQVNGILSSKRGGVFFAFIEADKKKN